VDRPPKKSFTALPFRASDFELSSYPGRCPDFVKEALLVLYTV
jgi:hypothetical protein